ncbi:MAG: TRAM domain-containing protein, partial [Bacillota bacterium]
MGKIMECLRLSSDGSGVGYTNGLVTFVPGLLPGEAGEIQVVERKARYQKARLIKVLNPSRFRRDPPCSVY